MESEDAAAEREVVMASPTHKTKNVPSNELAAALSKKLHDAMMPAIQVTVQEAINKAVVSAYPNFGSGAYQVDVSLEAWVKFDENGPIIPEGNGASKN